MKKIFTSLVFSVLLLTSYAQDKMFVHHATEGNISTNATIIDNALLNGNPDAKLIISHVFNPPGAENNVNTHLNGVYYDAGASRWMIYNEDQSTMTADLSFFVYVADDAYAIKHVVTTENQDPPSYTVVDHPNLNGNPNAIAVMSNKWESLYNNVNSGFWYYDFAGRWMIFTEDNAAMPLGVAFFIASEGEQGIVGLRHVATVENISDQLYYTEIDHPLLNENQDARFVFSHNWGSSGESSNIMLDKVTGAYYNETTQRWNIYTEDISEIFVGTTFDVLIFDPNAMATTELTSANSVQTFPNPVIDIVNFNSKNIILEISIYDLAGKQVLNSKQNSVTAQMNVSSLASGVYIAKIKTDKELETLKLIKK